MMMMMGTSAHTVVYYSAVVRLRQEKMLSANNKDSATCTACIKQFAYYEL